jgi:hypothetical protein
MYQAHKHWCNVQIAQHHLLQAKQAEQTQLQIQLLQPHLIIAAAARVALAVPTVSIRLAAVAAVYMLQAGLSRPLCYKGNLLRSVVVATVIRRLAPAARWLSDIRHCWCRAGPLQCCPVTFHS